MTHDHAAGGGSDEAALGMTIDSSGRILTTGISEKAPGDMDMTIWRINP